mgnify:CR=1 FL=1
MNISFSDGLTTLLIFVLFFNYWNYFFLCFNDYYYSTIFSSRHTTANDTRWNRRKCKNESNLPSFLGFVFSERVRYSFIICLNVIYFNEQCSLISTFSGSFNLSKVLNIDTLSVFLWTNFSNDCIVMFWDQSHKRNSGQSIQKW